MATQLQPRAEDAGAILITSIAKAMLVRLRHDEVCELGKKLNAPVPPARAGRGGARKTERTACRFFRIDTHGHHRLRFWQRR